MPTRLAGGASCPQTRSTRHDRDDEEAAHAMPPGGSKDPPGRV